MFGQTTKVASGRGYELQKSMIVPPLVELSIIIITDRREYMEYNSAVVFSFPLACLVTRSLKAPTSPITHFIGVAIFPSYTSPPYTFPSLSILS